MYGSDRGGGGVSRSEICSGTFLRNLNTAEESSAQAQSIGIFMSKLGQGGGLWTCPKGRGTRAQVQAAG